MIRSKPIKTLAFVTLLGTADLFAATSLAAKGGKRGVGNDLAPAVMEFRDDFNDTIASDGVGPDVDDISNVQRPSPGVVLKSLGTGGVIQSLALRPGRNNYGDRRE